jgi:hypothetical protein
MKCANCDAALRPGQSFCEVCGQPLKCPDCHADLISEELFCGSCGRLCRTQEYDEKLGNLCLSCSAANRLENNFCSHCGQPLWFGWPEEKVLATLGEPNEKEKGRYWILTESNQSTRFVEQCSDGSVRHIDGALVHGPIAPGTRIPVFTPYETWRYHNVRDNVLQLYLTQTPEGQRIVADVCQYPVGVVF